ncbi:insulinase family protein [Candidatus Falkowbacteria bacterium]|nr:insulinase family protein [Candidatus Falkowbacteria bacterium]
MHKITKLQSGLRLITIPLKETQAVTVLVLVKVGSRYESLNLNGASHFIEHLMFKGTKKRPNTLALSQELDSVGAEFNAFTSKDHTGYYIKLDSSHLELAIDMLSDMLQNSKFDAQEINREKGAITEEINMYEDNPLLLAPAFLEEVMFGKNNFLGQLIIGSKENIKKITRSHLLKFRDQFYNPSNMVIAICGNFKQDGAVKLIKKYFNINGQWPAPSRVEGSTVNCQPHTHKQTKPQIEIKYKKTEQAQLCLGYPAYSYTHPKIDALNILNIILGANMSSRLFINVRERRGLCYFIKSDINPYEDTGSFLIQAGLDKSRLSEAIKVIKKEITNIKKDGVSPMELKKAKSYLQGKTILSLEESSDLADWYATQKILTNKITTPEEKIKCVFKVSLADVKRVANDIFKPEKTNLALIGDFHKQEKLLKLLL